MKIKPIPAVSQLRCNKGWVDDLQNGRLVENRRSDIDRFAGTAGPWSTGMPEPPENVPPCRSWPTVCDPGSITRHQLPDCSGRPLINNPARTIDRDSTAFKRMLPKTIIMRFTRMSWLERFAPCLLGPMSGPPCHDQHMRTAWPDCSSCPRLCCTMVRHHLGCPVPPARAAKHVPA